MNRVVEEVAEDIRTMKVQGAIQIAILAEKALKSVIEDSKAETKEEFVNELIEAATLLKETRPTAVALPNAADILIDSVSNIQGDLEKTKKSAQDIVSNMIKSGQEGIKKIGEVGEGLVEDNSVVLIHCHSSTVISILKEANRQGKKFKVICTETRPWHQGYISAKELSEMGIATTLIVDSAVAYFMKDVNLVLVGADTITKNGDLINKIGTSQIALVAKHFDVPLYTATHTIKFDKKKISGEEVLIEERPASEIIDPKKLPNVKIKNPIFDITKPEYIAGYITEKGILKELGK